MDKKISVIKVLWKLVLISIALTMILYTTSHDFILVIPRGRGESQGIFQLVIAFLILAAALVGKEWSYRLGQWGCGVNLVLALLNAFQNYIMGGGIRPDGTVTSVESMQFFWLMVFALISLHYLKQKGEQGTGDKRAVGIQIFGILCLSIGLMSIPNFKAITSMKEWNLSLVGFLISQTIWCVAPLTAGIGVLLFKKWGRYLIISCGGLLTLIGLKDILFFHFISPENLPFVAFFLYLRCFVGIVVFHYFMRSEIKKQFE